MLCLKAGTFESSVTSVFLPYQQPSLKMIHVHVKDMDLELSTNSFTLWNAPGDAGPTRLPGSGLNLRDSY
jgi:hypothetical protein